MKPCLIWPLCASALWTTSISGSAATIASRPRSPGAVVALAQPASVNVTAGSSLTLTAQPPVGATGLQWFRDGVPVPEAPYAQGAQAATLKVSGVTTRDAGKYQLKWNPSGTGTGTGTDGGESAVTTVTVTGKHVRWVDAADLVADAVNSPLPATGEVVTNGASFTLRASGLEAFDQPGAVGDNGFFRYEAVTGDFDKRVRLVGLAVNPPVDPAEAFARGSLMVRATVAPNTPTLELAAANPQGGNLVRVLGRGRVDQIVSRRLSRDYPGVKDTLPNQWLRIQRVGDAFSFYVGTNGTAWSLVAQQYQSFPGTVLVGTFAAPDDTTASGASAEAEFADYGDVLAVDTNRPVLLSAGTIDQQWVGVKFSKPMSSLSATQTSHYRLSEGSIVGAQMGVAGDAVYLQVKGVTNTTFSVTVNEIVDHSGNAVAADSTATIKKSNWTMTDIGFIQDPAQRPLVGDDPYRVGQAVALSSEANPEVEIVGGGSNAFDPGDFLSYLHRPYTGDFDVAVAVNRFDRRGIAGGYGNAGIHVRGALYRNDNDDIAENTKVAAYANLVYFEASEPNRAAIVLHRPNPGENYTVHPPHLNTQEIGGLQGYYPELRAVNAAGALAAKSSARQSHWLRVKRVGTRFTSYFSYDGIAWVEQADAGLDLPRLSGTVLVGFGNQNDTGFGVPPGNTYAGNGTTDVDGNPTQNESNYGVLRINQFGDYTPPVTALSLTIRVVGTDVVITYTGSLESSATLGGAYTPVSGTSPVRLPLGSTTGTRFYRVRN